MLADHQAGLRLYEHCAKWTPLGSDCAGVSPAPVLTVTTAPAFGGSFALAVNGLGSGIPVMVTELAAAHLPVAPRGFGFGNGCTLGPSLDALDLLPSTAGAASWSLQVPNAIGLRGVHLYNQVAELGAPSALSNGGVGVID